MSQQWVETFPPLPVPELSQSCEKYLKSVKPFLSSAEYKRTEFIVDTFRTGVGKTLQEKLKKRAESKDNWLVDWWMDGYAAYRGSLPFYSNIGGCVPDMPSDFGSQISRGAAFLRCCTHKYLIIQNKKWPQTFMKRETPLDMKLFHGLFATARMPGLEKDTILNYSLKDGQPSLDMRHVVVMKRNRFYTFDVLTPNLEVLTTPEIERQFHRINAMAESKDKGPGVGAFTAIDRTSWKKTQDYLFSLDENNRKIVDTINKSLVVFILDDKSPKTVTEVVDETIMGDCKNRWFDKGMQLVVYQNGFIGNNNDHVHVDGFMVVDLFDRQLKNMETDYDEWKGPSKTRFLPQPEELEFTVDDLILSKINAAEMQHNAAKEKHCIINKPFLKFGKRFAKDHSIHPDALFQMAIQLAYYNLHQRFAATYETATTRKFHDGRTETVRSCTLESQTFVNAMHDSKSSMATRLRLLREACENHQKMMVECCEGQGIDRHFLGLKIISQQEGMELPEIFKDKAWKLSGGDGNFPLSTSIAGYDIDKHGGMGPITPDGYGIYYTIKKESIQIFLSTFGTPGTDCQGMWNAIHDALCNFRDLLLHSKL
eukprot:gene3570-4074_t